MPSAKLAFVLSAITFVSSLPISDKVQKPIGTGASFQSAFPFSQDSNLPSFPEESNNLILPVSEFRFHRAQFTSKSRLHQKIPNIFRNPGRVIFDEDNDEPLVPEPVFESSSRYPTTPGSSSNQRKKIIKVIENERRPTQLPPGMTLTTSRSISKLPTKTIPKFSSRPVTEAVSSTTKVTRKPQLKIIQATNLPSSSATTNPPSTTTKIKQIEATKESQNECVESQEGVCDEILTEGSFYSSFRVQAPESTAHRNHPRRKHNV